MKTKRIFSGLYILALLSLIAYIAHDALQIDPGAARYFYYLAMAIFGAGLIRVVYLIIRSRK